MSQKNFPEPVDLSDILVVTVSYGSGDVLKPFLSALREDSLPGLRVAVADNKPNSDSVESLAATFDCAYLPLPENPGYGAAINRAVAAYGTTARWILACNPDLVISLDAVKTMLRRALSDPQIACVGPQILEPDGSVYPSARVIPSLRVGIGHALFANIWEKNPWSSKYHNESEEDSARETGWLSGACVLIRKSIFDELDGFDEGYFMYFEDVDLGYRTGLAGYKNIYEPAATATHTGAHSTQGDSSYMLRVHHQSAARFLSKKYSGPLLWPLRAALKVGLWVRGNLTKRKTG
ncbi:glycosyltransferase family 2 protein [Lysinibacter sp. HNR]|uniref:glycosyltransferase family 2 protein n=1 Tax=Lysinibacter sp. HNR TaxID=3031408 RepID=UPI0024354D06|nr:glycosyltransferase family 2 protein [Lysinibacter sp. HNR]WGD38059.1 glycosyltransferase family 2 protein [Lysinibacter sp. HNR]